MITQKKNAPHEILAVAIITRNRSQILEECLYSLMNQSLLPEEIIIIDNNSDDDTSSLIKRLQKNTRAPIQYHLEKHIGCSFARNRVLRETRCDWLAFIDDDCVADKDWVKNIKKTVTIHPETSAILGTTETYYPTNSIAVSINMNDYYWKQKRISKNKIVDTEILDTKNVVFNMQFIRKNNITFAEVLNRKMGGSSEDCDFGLKIGTAGGSAIFQESMLVYHKDPTSFYWYLHTFILTTLQNIEYLKLWQEYPFKTNPVKYLHFVTLFNKYKDKHKFTRLQSVRVFMLSFCSLFITKIIYVIYNLKK